MIQSYGPITQALLGTLFTWAVTAAGSSLVFIFKTKQRKILDGSLGFAAGVMLAASYWSLLDPALEMTSQTEIYGNHSYFPVAIGFGLGAFFVYFADVALQQIGISNNLFSLSENHEDVNNTLEKPLDNIDANLESGSSVRQRRNVFTSENVTLPEQNPKNKVAHKALSWKRILLLIIAITVHNIPEGLAVGIGFAAVGKSMSASFANARNLAIGIGIQNFPEGLAVSLPLCGAGLSTWKSFWYGQLSGMVEPIAGVIGALVFSIAEPILPYALAFAAGAMIYVVNDDIIPEAQEYGNGKLASLMSIIGFIVMMSLDVGLG